MGFDVYGKKATSETGEYFRRNVWGWRRLADLVCVFEPKLTSRCKYWQSNDGAGLSARDSVLLADRLDAWLESGRVKEYIDKEDAELKALPRQKCGQCNGTGIRTDVVGMEASMPDKIVGVEEGEEQGNPRFGLKGWCNACNGWGSSKQMETWYSLDVDDVKEFSAFLRDSGGFRIC